MTDFQNGDLVEYTNPVSGTTQRVVVLGRQSNGRLYGDCLKPDGTQHRCGWRSGSDDDDFTKVGTMAYDEKFAEFLAAQIAQTDALFAR